MYNPNANGQQRLGVEQQGGAATIFTKSVATGEEKVLHIVATKGPLYWVGNVIVYGASGALHALSAQGGSAKQIVPASLPSDSNFHFY